MQTAAAYAIAAICAVFWFLSAKALVRALNDKKALQSLLNTATNRIHAQNHTEGVLREEIEELKKIVDLSNQSG